MKITIRRRGSDNFINSIMFIAVALILLMLFPSVYYCQNELLLFIIATFLLCIACVYSIVKCKARVSYKLVWFLVGYILLTLIYWMLRGRGTLNCPYYMLFAFCIFILFHNYLLACDKLLHFLNIFVVTIFVIACISLVFWMFGSILGVLESTNRVYMNWNGYRYVKSFYNIYFEVQGADVNFLGIHLGRRNCALFVEAPMACFVFSLALILNINDNKINPKVINTILIVAILSTLSTTGIVVLLLCLLQKVLGVKSRNRIEKALIMIISLVVVIAVLILGYLVVARKLDTNSGVIRSNMITSEFSGFLKSPIFGNGFGEFTYGSSNSFFALLADGGIFLWGVYYIPLLYVLLDKLIKKRSIDWFVLIFMCMFAITVVQYYIITIFIVTMFWCRMITNRGKEEKL